MTVPDSDATRRAVADMYEDYPYPDHGVVSSGMARMARPLIERAQERSGGETVRVLDAGCGTGEDSLGLARAFPDTEVVGVDVSARSLERARFYARKHRIPVRFEHHDLLDDQPGAIIGQFDVIVSVGVLHHLPDPDRALVHLRRIARPGAELLGMVYGRFGKAGMLLTRDAIGLLAGSGAREQRLSVLDGIPGRRTERFLDLAAELQRRRRFGPDLSVLESVRRVLAGRNRAFAADSYTHAHELTFTWAEVEALLERTGWTWKGWPGRAGLPDRPEAVFTDRALDRAQQLSPHDLAAVYERLLRPSNLFFVASA